MAVVVTSLLDTPVAVFGIGAGCGPELALGLSDLGAPIALLYGSAEEEIAKETAAQAVSRGRAATAVPFDVGSAAAVTAALATASQTMGEVRAVLDIANPGAAASPTPLRDTAPLEWDQQVTAPLRHALYRLQGTHAALRAAGGRVVVVLPSLSMSGASGMVAWTTASEGHRAFAKVAARAWGTEGITVNCIGIPAQLLAPEKAQGSLDRPGLPGLSLGRLPDPRSDVAEAVAALLGTELSFVTGATLAVDGGVWMTP